MSRLRRAVAKAVTAGACTVAGLACTLVPAEAATDAGGPVSGRAPDVAGPLGDHVMGAAIRAHEGLDGLLGDVVHRLQSALSSPLAPASGMDVSHYQGAIDWHHAAATGARFVYIKATEGTGFRDPRFNTNYSGATAAGIPRGAYHYARPDGPGGAVQARYFLAHGGGWSADGRTLPGALDLEYGSAAAGGACYGQTQTGMADWIRSFSDTYTAATGRHPVLYTSTRWWQRCVGGHGGFAAANPLWIARYAPEAGPLPAPWHRHVMWQYANHGAFPGDQDQFNGNGVQARAFTLLG